MEELDWIGLDWVWSQKKHNSNNSYRSEDHVQRHGNVKVESIVVDHTNSEEHGDHNPIVSGGKKEERYKDFLPQNLFFIFYLNTEFMILCFTLTGWLFSSSQSCFQR